MALNKVEICGVNTSKLKVLKNEETMALLKRFAMKYYPDEALADQAILEGGRAVRMCEIEIEHLSGKEVQER